MSPEKFKPWQSMRREQEVGIALFPSKTILNSPKHHKRDCLLPTTADNLEAWTASFSRVGQKCPASREIKG